MNQKTDTPSSTQQARDPVPDRQIRASCTDPTIRGYQAFSDAIAEPALAAGSLQPPFKLERMTWIKPSSLDDVSRGMEQAQARLPVEHGYQPQVDDSAHTGL